MPVQPVCIKLNRYKLVHRTGPATPKLDPTLLYCRVLGPAANGVLSMFFLNYIIILGVVGIMGFKAPGVVTLAIGS